MRHWMRRLRVMVKAIIKIIDEDTNDIKDSFELQPSIITFRIEHSHSERHVKYKFNFNYEEVLWQTGQH